MDVGVWSFISRMRRNRLHLAFGELVLVVAPGHRGLAVFDHGHGDAVVDGADERAEIAADTVLLADLGDGLVRDAAGAEADLKFVGRLEVDALVGAVLAGDVAEVAADALLVVDAGDTLPVQVEILPFLQRVDGFAAELKLLKLPAED